MEEKKNCQPLEDLEHFTQEILLCRNFLLERQV